MLWLCQIRKLDNAKKGKQQTMLSPKVNEILDSTGKLPSFSSYGCHPIFYVTNHNDVLCPNCANDAHEYGDYVADYDVNWEDAQLYCDECSERIESAYAEEEV